MTYSKHYLLHYILSSFTYLMSLQTSMTLYVQQKTKEDIYRLLDLLTFTESTDILLFSAEESQSYRSKNPDGDFFKVRLWTLWINYPNTAHIHVYTAIHTLTKHAGSKSSCHIRYGINWLESWDIWRGHTHPHMLFFWLTGTLHRRNGFYTVQNIFYITLQQP